MLEEIAVFWAPLPFHGSWGITLRVSLQGWEPLALSSRKSLVQKNEHQAEIKDQISVLSFASGLLIDMTHLLMCLSACL